MKPKKEIHMQAQLPSDEKERLKALQGYDILDTDPEQEFDDIALLASQICGTPIAMVSLVDENRQWFKSKVGTSASQTSRDIAFCAHGILQAEVFIVNDALSDERFASNPLVTGETKIRFYAGAPLITPDGQTLGMLCVNDHVPRELSVVQKAALQSLSRQVVTLLELRQTVAQLRRTQEELEWKTAFLEAQVNSSLDGILVVDEDDKKILQNQRTAELLKLPKEIMDDEHGPQQLQWVRGRVKNPEKFIERVNYIRSHPNEIGRDEVTFEDGTVLDRYSAPVVGKDGKRYGRIFTFRDITEHKRADDLLRQSEKRYRSLFDNAKDAIFTIATDGTFTSMNPAVEAMGGFSRADWIGKPFAPMVHPYDLPLAMEMFNRILRGEQASVHELRGNPSLKRPALMEMTLTSQRDETGKVIGVLGIGRDITERKRAEEQLRESEGKFRQLAENINDVFWMTSPDLQQVLYVSPAYEKVWGRSAANACEHPNEWSDAIAPEERERVFTTFGRLMAGESSVSVEFRITRPDGELRWIHSRGFQVRDAAGKVIRLTGIASDITVRKQFEAQLFQSQKLETVGKLSGGIAHEFNSILTAILGQCEMLLADLPSGSPSAKSATEISQAAGRAATLTRQLLAYGRKQFLKPETLDLNKVIAGMEGVFHHLMGGEVTTQIVPSPNLQAVKVDAGQIEQVIMNMAINARDAMPNGGKLTLETANVSIDEESVGRYPDLKAGKYVMLAITDIGAGMSEQVKARLFEPFFTTKGVGEGTGLGLSSCYGIIKQSGGHISVYSEPGRGTTFKIYLPQVEQQAKTLLKRPSSLALPRGIETILLVEDDPALREMAETLLNRLGYKVWPAANGIEALSLKQQRNVGHIDLLFTDVVMPHMSGKELADRVRSLYPHTRILFTSAYTENTTINQGMLDKNVALLQKPYTPSALAHKLREVLDQPNVPKSESRTQRSDRLQDLFNA
jgi:two-component system, cell cycle sensor histidine kinase and response regulator CckA